jgi:hypothetical protein
LIFQRDLEAAGFRTRAVNALVYGSGIKSIEELRSRPWGRLEDSGSLARALQVCPNLGKAGIAEIVAFRDGGDPRTAWMGAPARVTITLEHDLAAELDAWIAAQPEPKPSRPEAIRAFVAAGLAIEEPKPPAQFPNQVRR